MNWRVILFVSLVFSSFVFAKEKLPLPDYVDETQTAKVPGNLTGDEMTQLKARIKSEIIEELKSPEIEWQQTVQPHLNFLELNGYFRVRGEALNHCDLGTYVLPNGPGTSGCLPPLSYFDASSVDGESSLPSWLVSANMRFRLSPTLNISEDIRIKGTVDFFDNFVLGSTPHYMSGTAMPGSIVPFSYLSLSQNTPFLGVNTPYGSINVKRLWAEVTTPVGELRFGRLPVNFGLGLLFNSGESDTNDYGDQLDGILFATRLAGHYFVPGFFVSYTGAWGKGTGTNYSGRGGSVSPDASTGQRYDLDPSDNVYTFLLSFLKKDKQLDAKALLDEGKMVFNYGALLSYRFQLSGSNYTKLLEYEGDYSKLAADESLKIVDRNAHMGALSLWADFKWDKLQVEAEGVFLLGYVGNQTGLQYRGDNLGGSTWMSSGGFALQSKYAFLNDRLFVGVDGGFASGGNGDRYKNFHFNQAYQVDMMLFKRVLGTVSNAYYLKPHASYYFTDSFGVKAAVIGSFAVDSGLTPGKSSLLGLELDTSLFYETEEGIHFMVKYGLLVPFAGLNHDKSKMPENNFQKYGTAKTASAIQLFLGVNF